MQKKDAGRQGSSRRRIVLVTGLGVALTVATGGAQPPRQPPPQPPGPESFSSRVVVENLERPWEITWGPDDHLWVTERTTGRVLRVDPRSGETSVAVQVSDLHQSVTQDGLLGLVLHPDLLHGAASDFVYLSYTYDADPSAAVARRMKIRRYTYDPATGSLGNPVDLLDDLPAGDDHVSGRLVFGPDQRLYLSIGDGGANFSANYCLPNRAQDLPTAEALRNHDWSSYHGSVLRVNLDGSIPLDNPRLEGVRSHVFSYGHRNVQGLVFDAEGRLYGTEHGPSTDDELNLIVAGGNYGWPEVAGFQDDQVYEYAVWAASSPQPCSSLTFSERDAPDSVPRHRESDWHHPDFHPPLVTFFTVPNGYDFQRQGSATIAPSSLDLYPVRGDGIPTWENSLLIPSLSRGVVYRVQLGPAGRIDGEPTTHFKSTNRYRDFAMDPDGLTIYLATDNDGRTTDAAGNATRTVDNPGAILAFTYEAETPGSRPPGR